MISTGCRCEEVTKVQLSGIDWHTRSVEVIGKGNKRRIVYMSERAKLLCKKYIQERQKMSNCTTNFLFTSVRSPFKPLSVSGVEAASMKIGDLIGIHLNPHRLRHTMATIAVDRGMPVQELQILLGHSSLDTTMLYVKLSKENIKYHYSKCVI